MYTLLKQTKQGGNPVSLAAYFSCASNNAGVKEKATDLCTAMEKYNPEDPATLLEAYDAMAMIELDKDKYGDVTEEELLEQMKKDCPEGAEKYAQLKLNI